MNKALFAVPFGIFKGGVSHVTDDSARSGDDKRERRHQKHTRKDPDVKKRSKKSHDHSDDCPFCNVPTRGKHNQ